MPATEDQSRSAMSMWRTEITFCAFSLLVGTIAAALLLGPALNPTNIDWLLSDSAQNYMGWAFLRDDPDWTFPLTWTHRLGYPLGVSVGFLDSIPLVATALRPFSALLSHPFQYLGLFGGASLILQTYFGTRLAWRVTGQNTLAALLGGLFFVVAPCFIFRLGPHLSLTCQWLILAALWRYVTPHEGRSIWSWYWPFLLVQGIAGAIHPYVAILCLFSAWSGAARLFLQRRCSMFEALVLGAGATAATFAAFWLAGFVPVGTWRFYIAEPFGSYSMNLLSPIDPNEWGSILLPRHRLAFAAQLDGYNYLGLGALLLLTLGVAGFIWKRALPRWSLVLPLVVAALFSLMLALGPRITFGPYVLGELPLPEWLMSLLSPLRASGRMFWLAHYLLLLLALACVSRILRPAHQIALLTTCLLIQLADTRPLLSWVASGKVSRHNDPLTSTDWIGIGQVHKHLAVLPPWQCAPARTPGGPESYWPLGKVALRERMTSNTYYANRISDAERRVHCYETVSRMQAEGLSAEYAYVLDDQFMRLAAFQAIQHHYCRVVDGYNLCSTVPDKAGVEAPVLAKLFPAYSLGTVVAGDAAVQKFGAGGWESAERGAAWSVGYEAGLSLRLETPIESDLELVLQARAFTHPLHSKQEVSVFADAIAVAQLVFEVGKDLGMLRIRIPRETALGKSQLGIFFRTKDAQSPAALGLGLDSRPLGIHLESFELVALQ